eukprot:scaffold9564_cov85-Phaeocystis_antarctica.AAC.3
MAVAHTTRIARASVEKRARRRRQMPGGYMTSHHRLTTDSAHPACTMTKLTRSRRAAADARAARNTPWTAAFLVEFRESSHKPEGVLRAQLRRDVDREGEGAAPWTPTLGFAFAPRRSRRQLARPRSSRVGSRAMAMAAAKAIDVRRQSSRWLKARVAFSASRSSSNAGELGQPPRKRVEAHTAVACQITPLPGPEVNPRAVLLVALIVVRLALVPVGKAGSVTRHAAAPILGGAEPSLVLVEPEPQAIQRGELCRHEVILLHRADAGWCAPVLLAQVHAAEERGGALGRHEEAGGAGGRGGPAGWADSRRGGREKEDGGRRHHLLVNRRALFKVLIRDDVSPNGCSRALQQTENILCPTVFGERVP